MLSIIIDAILAESGSPIPFNTKGKWDIIKRIKREVTWIYGLSHLLVKPLIRQPPC